MSDWSYNSYGEITSWDGEYELVVSKIDRGFTWLVINHERDFENLGVESTEEDAMDAAEEMLRDFKRNAV